MASDETIKINRSYMDNFDVKDFTVNTLVPKYFTGDNISERNVGLLGLTTEQISNISEDVFNTGSVYAREVYPNRAELPESIYSHAAIFEITDLFATPCTCKFVLVLEEASIIKNLKYGKNKVGYFYIDKNTIINVEGIDFSLDYDIMIKVIQKNYGTKSYVFSASYMMNGEMINTINPQQNPYIPMKRSKDGFLALEIVTHQYIREVHYESILTNAKINAPVIDIPFTGQLAGFDVLYKTPEETEYTTQLSKQVLYSQPSTEPFCYFTKKDENTLRITFNSKDLYFMPEFNSSLKVTLYITNGASAKFPMYTGNQISIQQAPEKYAYADQFIMGARPSSESYGGTDALSLEGLRSLAVQGFRTANALTTDGDLAEYFSNYSYMYGKDNLVKFIKKRNDIFERLYGAVIVIRDGEDIYKTNTLNIDLNIGDMLNPETNIYTIEPGVLFRYGPDAGKNTDSAVPYRDTGLRAKYQESYNEALDKLTEERESPYYDGGKYSILEAIALEDYNYYMPYVIDNPGNTSMNGWYYIRNDKTGDTGVLFNLYDANGNHKQSGVTLAEIESGINAGIIKDELSPILDLLYVKSNRKEAYDYLKYRTVSLSEWITRNGEVNAISLFDLTDEELQKYSDNRSALRYDTLRDEWYEDISQRFLFVNPFLIRFYRNPNTVNMYLTYVDQDVTFDFTDQNDDSFIQFVAVKMNVQRNFEETKRYTFKTVVESNVTTSLSTAPLLDVLYAYTDSTDGSIYKQASDAEDLYDRYTAENVLINDKEDRISGDVVRSMVRSDTNLRGTLIPLEDEFDYRVGSGVDVRKNALRVVGCMRNDDGSPICWFEFKPTAYDAATDAITFEAEVYTDDHITSDGKIRLSAESKFFDKRDTYTYYKSKYPEKLDGSPIYDGITDPLEAAELIKVNDLIENGAIVINSTEYPDYTKIGDFMSLYNDVKDSSVTGVNLDVLNLPVFEGVDTSKLTGANITAQIMEDPAKRAVYIFMNNTASNHTLYMICRVIDGNDSIYYAVNVGTGYYYTESTYCYPEYYEVRNGVFLKYSVVNGIPQTVIADSTHSNGEYTVSELDALSSKDNALEKVVVASNPNLDNYYMYSQTKPTVLNYYIKGTDGVHRMQRHSDGKAVEYTKAAIPSFGMLIEEVSTHIMTEDEFIFAPIKDLNVEVYMLTNYVARDPESTSESMATFDVRTSGDGDNIFTPYDYTLANYSWTNKYTTITNTVTLVKPLNNCKVIVDFEDYTVEGTDIMDIKMNSVPFIKWEIAKDPEKFKFFVRNFAEEYDVLTSIINTRLRNQSELDIKLYNTYGLATNFVVGESSDNPRSLDTLNLSMEFDVWFDANVDRTSAIEDVKSFIKDTVEEINTSGFNNLFISNLMRKIETNFEAVDHIRFVRINNYDSTIQTIRNRVTELEEIDDKEERRMYVPELLTVDLDNVVINDYTI